MDLKIVRSDDADGRVLTAVAVTGFIDISNSRDLIDAGLSALEDGGSLAVDLSGVDFMDSTGIGALVELGMAAKGPGQTFEVSATSEPVRRVLELTGLADRWAPTEA